MDVKTAFLNGDLREDIYMVQPPGFIERGEEEYGLQIKEIICTKGGQIDIRAIELDGILVKPESRHLLQTICERERVSMAVIGTINGEGRAVLIDSLVIKKNANLVESIPLPLPSIWSLRKYLVICHRKVLNSTG
ncbi:hypothetical protein ACFX13_043731 [Malus domestica]